MYKLDDFGDACYSLKDFVKIKRYNRRIYQTIHDAIYYCRDTFEVNYVMCVDGEVYFMRSLFRGIVNLNKKYGKSVPLYRSFDELFFLGKKLPKHIDYVTRIIHNEYSSIIRHVSCKNKFTLYISNSRENLEVAYSDDSLEKVLEELIW